MYLTYDEYIQQGGALDSAAFARLEFRARREVDERTLGRLKPPAVISEAVKRLMYELIGTMDKAEQTKSASALSYANDGVSVSLAKPPSEAETAAKLDDLTTTYLAGEKAENGVPLLYLGVC